MGDVKTKTARYPIKKIQELCGDNPGDWSCMTSELEDGTKIMAVGHRRGGEVRASPHKHMYSCMRT